MICVTLNFVGKQSLVDTAYSSCLSNDSRHFFSLAINLTKRCWQTINVSVVTDSLGPTGGLDMSLSHVHADKPEVNELR